MRTTTISKALLALVALLNLCSAAPLRVIEFDLKDVLDKVLNPVQELPSIPFASALPTGHSLDATDVLSERSLKSTKVGTTSSGTSEESSGSNGSKSKTSGLLDTVEPFAASWLGKKIGDQIGGSVGLTSSETTSTADASTETAASAHKERRKLKSSSGSSSGSSRGSSSGSSRAGSTFDLGKNLLTGTLMNGASQVGGDFIASNLENAMEPASTADAASAMKELRRMKASSSGSSSSSSGNSGSSVVGSALDAGKSLITSTLLNGASQVGGDYIADGIESAVAPASTTDTAATRKRSYEDESPLGDLANNIRIGTVDLTPDDNFVPEGSPNTPTSVRAEKRRSAIGSIAKTIGGDVVEQGFSSLVGDLLAGKARD